MIENYLGFPNGVTGADLARRAATQAKRFGTEVLVGHSVVGLRREDPYQSRAAVERRGSGVPRAGAVVGHGGARARRARASRRCIGAGVYYGAALSRGGALSRPARVRARRRELGGAGRAVLRALRGAGHDDRPQADAARRRCRTTWSTGSSSTENITVHRRLGDRGRARRRPPRAARRPQRRDRRDAEPRRATRCSSSSASRRAPRRSAPAGRDRRQGIHPHRRRRARGGRSAGSSIAIR